MGKNSIGPAGKIELHPGLVSYVASPEDIIISKMIYYREGGSEKHMRDITGILKISGEEIDMDYINRWSEDLDLMEIWQAILGRIRHLPPCF